MPGFLKVADILVLLALIVMYGSLGLSFVGNENYLGMITFPLAIYVFPTLTIYSLLRLLTGGFHKVVIWIVFIGAIIPVLYFGPDFVRTNFLGLPTLQQSSEVRQFIDKYGDTNAAYIPANVTFDRKSVGSPNYHLSDIYKCSKDDYYEQLVITKFPVATSKKDLTKILEELRPYKVTPVNISGNDGLFAESVWSGGTVPYKLLWQDSRFYYELRADSCKVISLEELLKMARSIQ